METKKKEKEYVIYSIENLKTGEKYIGRTGNYRKRKSQHFNTLKKNEHHNIYLQTSWNTYDRDCFEMKPIHKCKSLKDSHNQEIYYIALYGLDNLFNISEGGADDFTYGITSGLGTKVATKVNGNPVYKLTLDGDIIDEFSSAANAGRACNIDASSICSCCKRNGINNTSGGYQWCLVSDYDESNKPKVHSKKKAVYQLDLDGNIITTYESTNEAARTLGKCISASISTCCNRKKGTAGGFQWRFVDDYSEDNKPKARKIERPVYRLDFQGDIIKEYPSATIASKELGLSASTTISKCCTRKAGTCRESLWRFVDDYDENNKPKGLAMKKPVYCLDSDGNIVKEYLSISEASRQNGLTSHSSITKSCRLKTGIYGGYTWRFVSDYDKQN